MPATGPAALQGRAGNAAVVQLLRASGHSWAQDEHQHSAACGHQQAEQPAVQRSAVHDVLRTAGRPLDEATRSDMEGRLGADFSDVRIHNDSAAKASAAEVGARAYTSGSHVVIGDGGADQHTLAHELTHVIQQRQGPVAGTDNGGGLKVSDPSDRFEREAEANAHRAMAAPASEVGVQRRTQDAPSVPGADLVVQRVTYPEDPDQVQDVLKQSFWESQVPGGKKTVAQAKKNIRKELPRGKVRPLGDIVGGIANQLLAQLATKSPTAGTLKLYRGMSSAEADAVLAWAGVAGAAETPRTRAEDWIRDNPKGKAAEWHESGNQIIPVGTHLGDQKQAHNYVAGNPGYRMLEFTLKPGAYEELFDPQYAALAPAGDAPTAINKAIPGHVAANANEGTLGGYVGIKSEEEGYFSVNPGKSSKRGDDWVQTPGHLLFQMFLQEVREVTGDYDAASLTSTRMPG
ncbi:DUF4157 domain-containing protein [Streptomyces sp. NPDC048111]|uniref:eCIS core domain-containing protein n=1 Tax=Streptomyces sp. NPDC048111 TaxID=3365500 RepID=UPI0037216CF3